MAIKCVVLPSGWDKRLKIWEVLKQAGLCPVSPEECVAIQLNEEEATEFASSCISFVIPEEAHELENPFWVIHLRTSFESGIQRLNREIAHIRLPDETISEGSLIPAEVHDFLIWPTDLKEEKAINATFHFLSEAA